MHLVFFRHACYFVFEHQHLYSTSVPLPPIFFILHCCTSFSILPNTVQIATHQCAQFHIHKHILHTHKDASISLNYNLSVKHTRTIRHALAPTDTCDKVSRKWKENFCQITWVTWVQGQLENIEVVFCVLDRYFPEWGREPKLVIYLCFLDRKIARKQGGWFLTITEHLEIRLWHSIHGDSVHCKLFWAPKYFVLHWNIFKGSMACI